MKFVDDDDDRTNSTTACS